MLKTIMIKGIAVMLNDKYQIKLSEVNSIEGASTIMVPVLFVHGEEDTLVKPHHS